MIFRRRKADQDQSEDLEAGTAGNGTTDPGAEAVEMNDLTRSRPHGPWDRTETSVDEDDPGYVDLGGMLVRGRPGLELRLQVNEATQNVEAVMLAGPESGLELRAFAAPRWDSIWDDVRKDIAAEASKRGGTATEVDGEFGTELKVVVPVQTPDGRQATQPSRIVGVEGPRWLLRGTFLGKSAQEADPEGIVEQAFHDVIVVRGEGPMAPREMIAMQVPTEAVRADQPADDGSSADSTTDPESEA